MSANERVRPPSSSREANTGLAVRSPLGHLAHALGQQHQRPRDLVAEHRRQQHARRTPPAPAPASACRCTCGASRPGAIARAAGIRDSADCTASALLTSCGATVCVTNRKRSSRAGQGDFVARNQRQCAHARHGRVAAGRRLVVEPLELAGRAGGARLTHQRGRRPLRRDRTGPASWRWPAPGRPGRAA